MGVALPVALLMWGLYTFVVYIGVPVHSSVLFPGDTQELVNSVCGSNAYFCRGVRGVLGFFLFTFGERLQPFTGYVLVSIGLFVLFSLWQWFRTGRPEFRITLTPWKVVLLFLLSLWLFFMTLGGASSNFRLIAEPDPLLYPDTKDQQMEVLQDNFRELQGRHCLTFAGRASNGSNVHLIKHRCIQLAFITRGLPYVAFVVFLLFEFLVLGRALLSLFRIRPKHLLFETTLSAALGACGLIVLLWILSILSLLTAPFGWGLVLLTPLFCFRHTFYWVRRFLFAKWTTSAPLWSGGVVVGWLLLSYLAFNFLNVIRPFPIGWDDLGSYLNRPRLLVSYGHFIFSMAPFQWEYLTSLGFLLFGYDSTFGTITSMMVNWTAGVLAVLAIITFVQTLLGAGGLLAAVLYYLLPLVGHFSFADMKTDNAVFAFGALCILCGFVALFQTANDERERTSALRWLFLAGIFGGFGFATKATTIMVILALLPVLVGAMLHWSGFVAGLFFSWSVYAYKGIFDLNRIFERIGADVSLSQHLFVGVIFITGTAFFAYAVFRRRENVLPLLRAGCFFVAGILVTVLPWLIHNNLLQGSFPPKFEMGAPNHLTPALDISGEFFGQETDNNGRPVRSLPSDLVVDINHPACAPTGHKEELDRYWGNREGWQHYLTLPWRTVMNIDSAGYYVTTMPALLLFPLLLLLPFFWDKEGRWLRYLFGATLFMVAEWAFLANGVPWYGIGMFLGLCIGLELLVRRAPNVWTKSTTAALLTVSIVVMLGNRFWQFNQMRNILEYPIGKTNEAVMRERTIPYYDNISDIIVDLHELNPGRPYVYRVGTFIPYFIPRNLEIIAAADHQLDLFTCLHQEKEAELTLQRLQHLGFNSVVFDTNTATIERDPNGSLHQKVQEFVNFLNRSDLGFQIIANDLDEGIAYVILP